jgi:hypothetical protein
VSFFHKGITVTDPARLDLDADLTARGLRNWALNDFKVSTGLADLNCLHGEDSFRLDFGERLVRLEMSRCSALMQIEGEFSILQSKIGIEAICRGAEIL